LTSPLLAIQTTKRKQKNMAKTTKPVIKKTTPATPAPVAEKKTRIKQSVLLKVTASKLRELIGADTEIGVSRKELNALVTKGATAAALAAAGLQ
jgi:hypothetical protein